MLSRNLEQTLHRALSLASERRHEYATLEHLLLGLADDSDAATVLRACGVDLDKLLAAAGVGGGGGEEQAEAEREEGFHGPSLRGGCVALHPPCADRPARPGVSAAAILG